MIDLFHSVVGIIVVIIGGILFLLLFNMLVPRMISPLLNYPFIPRTWKQSRDQITHHLLNTVEGQVATPESDHLLHHLSSQPDPSPMDLYQLGILHEYQYHKPEHAEQYYQQSLSQIQTQLSRRQYYPQSLFRQDPRLHEMQTVVDRIRNRMDVNDLQEYDEFHDALPHMIQLQRDLEETQARINQFRIRDREYKERHEQKARQERKEEKKVGEHKEQKEGKKEGKEKKEEKKKEIEWKIDTQNVHDHFINESLVKQFNSIEQQNIRESKSPASIYQIKQSLGSFLPSSEQIEYQPKIHKAGLMLDKIRENDQGLVRLHGRTEEYFLGHVWTHLASQPNKAEISKCFIQNLVDSWNKGSPVCVTGRITRVMSSFAHLDSDPRIGLLVTKEVVRNEIMEKVAKIRNEILQALPADQRKKYEDATETTPETQQIEARMKTAMETMIQKEYGMIVDPGLLTTIKNEVLVF